MLNLVKTALGLLGIIVLGTTLWGMVTNRTLDGWPVLVIAGICAINLFGGGKR